MDAGNLLSDAAGVLQSAWIFVSSILGGASNGIESQAQAYGWSLGFIVIILTVIVFMLLFKNQIGEMLHRARGFFGKLFVYALALVVLVGIAYLVYTVLLKGTF